MRIIIILLIKVITKKVDELSILIALEIGDRKGFVQLPWLKICHQINHYSVHIHAYAEICQIIGKWRPYLKMEWNTFQLKHLPTNEIVLMPTKIKLSRFQAKKLRQILNGQYYLYAGFKVKDTVSYFPAPPSDRGEVNEPDTGRETLYPRLNE